MHYPHTLCFSWLLDLICDSWRRYNNDRLKCISLWQENVGLSQIKCLPLEQIDSRFNKRLSILITRFSRFSKINYNSNRNLLRCTNRTFCSPNTSPLWNNTGMLSERNKNIMEWTNKQELSCLNTLNFYGSLEPQLCLSRSNIEVNKLRYFVFNWTMNVTPDWLDRVSVPTSLNSQSHSPSQPTPRHDMRNSQPHLAFGFYDMVSSFWNFHIRKPNLACLSGGKMLKLYNCFLLSSACRRYNF